ncbi:MAG: helix-turn-helix domain-containing protein [Acidimicrobiia bacterium]|nr:helix-turn-helix domain-containing protein [Acidimicrobiia bacterium]
MPSLTPLLKSRRRCRASLILDDLGVSQAKLTDALGVSTTSLSRMLRGGQPLPAGFEFALRASIGADGTDRMLAAIEAEADQ